MTASVAALKLLRQLFKRMSRQSKTFDKYQQVLLKKLQYSHSDKQTEILYNHCIEQLSEHIPPFEDTLSEGRLTVSQSHIQLKKIANLSDKTAIKLTNAQQISQPYSISEHHAELTQLIKIYQCVTIELNKNGQQTQDNLAEKEIIENIFDELQQIILDLDVGDNYFKKLEVIRKKISDKGDPALLPQYCLQIITIIIDSTRDERRTSRHFLYTLNDSLTQFYLDFSKNLKLTKRAFDTQEKHVNDIQQQSQSLKKETEQATDMTALQQYVFNYVDNIEKAFNDKEKQNKQDVREQFQSMVRQIKELQNETQNYQKTLKQQRQQLSIDFLTKIPNRVAWSERLQAEFIRYQRYQQPLNIAIIDIDKFKTINDTFGHLAGDKVLNVIAQTLQKSIRNTDFIARYGGEEFALLLPEVTQEQAHIALQKLCEAIKNIPFKFKKENISITISIGCAAFTQEDSDESAFERADQALYKAKKNGRDQVVMA